MTTNNNYHTELFTCIICDNTLLNDSREHMLVDANLRVLLSYLHDLFFLFIRKFYGLMNETYSYK